MRPSRSSLDCASLGTSARAEDDASVAGAAIYVRTYVRTYIKSKSLWRVLLLLLWHTMGYGHDSRSAQYFCTKQVRYELC